MRSHDSNQHYTKLRMVDCPLYRLLKPLRLTDIPLCYHDYFYELLEDPKTDCVAYGKY